MKPNKQCKHPKGWFCGKCIGDLETMPETLEEQIKEICTYYSEYGEGIAGYCLSEEQFKKLFTLFSQTLEELGEEIIGKDLPDDPGVKDWSKSGFVDHAFRDGQIDGWNRRGAEQRSLLKQKLENLQSKEKGEDGKRG
jgi:hypothetical protein